MSDPFSGPLHSKKKNELQAIASALRLSDSGTREELYNRVKKHIDNNKEELEEDDRLKGLVRAPGRKSRTSQPPEDIKERKPSSKKRVMALGRVPAESTPMKDLRDVSMFLKTNQEEEDEEGDEEEQEDEEPRTLRSATARSTSSSPVATRSLEKVSAAKRAKLGGGPSEAALVVEPSSISIRIGLPDVNGARGLITHLRTALSSVKAIYILSAISELLSIPWSFHKYPSLPVSVPTISVFVLFQAYLLPSILLPYLAGALISFRSSPISRGAKWDPLTGSIVRLATHIAVSLYFLPGSSTQTLSAAVPRPTPGLLGLTKEQALEVDAGVRWRILSAGVALAFAFADVIQNA